VFSSQDIQQFVSKRLPASSEKGTGTPGLRFSIVMPSFNHAQFIERSLLTVLNQRYADTELIVMDGGSKDGTRAILERYDSDITLWRSEPDKGQSDALNKGFRHATGDIFGWLNSDDLYLPGAFHDAARIFATDPEIDVVYGDWYSIDTSERLVERHPGLRPSRGRLITEGFFCNAQAMFWRRSLHERCGEFDPQLHYTMDYDLMLRLISTAGRRAFWRVGRPLGCFRVYPGQKTGSANDKVAAEHRHIARRAGVTWKYAARGRALRVLYRFKRAAEYLHRCGPQYALMKLKGAGSSHSIA
jgi:glycosyltransferase involved in cell wall biosynthesis